MLPTIGGASVANDALHFGSAHPTCCVGRRQKSITSLTVTLVWLRLLRQKHRFNLMYSLIKPVAFNISLNGRVGYFLLSLCGFIGFFIFLVFSRVQLGILYDAINIGLSVVNGCLFFYSLSQLFKMTPRFILSRESLRVNGYFFKTEIELKNIVSCREIRNPRFGLTFIHVKYIDRVNNKVRYAYYDSNGMEPDSIHLCGAIYGRRKPNRLA